MPNRELKNCFTEKLLGIFISLPTLKGTYADKRFLFLGTKTSM